LEKVFNKNKILTFLLPVHRTMTHLHVSKQKQEFMYHLVSLLTDKISLLIPLICIKYIKFSVCMLVCGRLCLLPVNLASLWSTHIYSESEWSRECFGT